MPGPTIVGRLRRKVDLPLPLMNERMRRDWAAAEALEIGWGGVSAVASATGPSRNAIDPGVRELEGGVAPGPLQIPPGRVRRVGGGRKPVTEHDASPLRDPESLVDPVTRGDPQPPSRWTCKSTRELAEELRGRGRRVGHRTAAVPLRRLNYSLQSDRETREGASHPDRNAQFEYMNAQVCRFQERGRPVVSVDAKRKESVGDFKNGGREYRPEGRPEEVGTRDFMGKGLGKAIPYGVYDVTADEGWVSVGIDHDAADFAAESLRRWWADMGSKVYPEAKGLLVTAAGGGSNGSRLRPWEVAIQELADAIGLKVEACHFPPGTGKWDQIEHRMFCHITQNWRGGPLRSLGVIVNLIGDTRAGAGLKIQAELDKTPYGIGIKVSDERLAAVRMKKDDFHGEWNYTISPKKK